MRTEILSRKVFFLKEKLCFFYRQKFAAGNTLRSGSFVYHAIPIKLLMVVAEVKILRKKKIGNNAEIPKWWNFRWSHMNEVRLSW